MVIANLMCPGWLVHAMQSMFCILLLVAYSAVAASGSSNLLFIDLILFLRDRNGCVVDPSGVVEVLHFA